MNERSVPPDVNWYVAKSIERGMLPRCPFASADRCPRYFQSVALLGSTKESTAIDPTEHERLFEKWKKTDVWPTVDEEATSTWGGKEGTTGFVNFCPEVSYWRFGLFASFLHRHSDEIDREAAHSQLSDEKAGAEDWRWNWQHISPMHYAECPLYAPLSSGIGEIVGERKRPIGFSHREA